MVKPFGQTYVVKGGGGVGSLNPSSTVFDMPHRFDFKLGMIVN